MEPKISRVRAGVLEVEYEEHGEQGGAVVILLHGYPYDVRAFDGVVDRLQGRGLRIVVPYLRGFGPTRFVSGGTMRSGQQAAIAHDLLAFMDALAVPRAVLAGFDWGGRGACIVAALWPERVAGLVSAGGYAIQDIPGSSQPLVPELEQRLWYQYYFHSERGRAGLTRYREEIGQLLWRLWSPNWMFDDATYRTTARSFHNPDFVDVVAHSYRHRFGLVDGDPAYEATEVRLQSLPPIAVPTVVLDGMADGVNPPAEIDRNRSRFTGPYQRRLLDGIGHNVPQEAPEAFAQAVWSLL